MRYVSALEDLFDQITLDRIAARGELIRRAPVRREDEPDADNPVVLFGQCDTQNFIWIFQKILLDLREVI